MTSCVGGNSAQNSLNPVFARLEKGEEMREKSFPGWAARQSAFAAQTPQIASAVRIPSAAAERIPPA